MNRINALGIELGSTRIKAILIDDKQEVVASGSFEWENQLKDGIWTYSLEDAWAGIRSSLESLQADARESGAPGLDSVGVMGVSAMMHGYLPFDREDKLLTPFRTWRNTMTEQAAAQLTELYQFNIPQRWSIAHLYQGILNGEAHVGEVAFITTLAGYIHWQLTGERVLGIGDASGMFPINPQGDGYNQEMLDKFDEKVKGYGFKWRLGELLPKVLVAGEAAGTLTEKGAGLLDPTGRLAAGIPLCPPEGDAGTGMVATNSILERTGNVSAGTSIFAMLVLEKELTKLHTEIDVVTTPTGKPVAMVHCNNCTSDLDAWVRLFGEFAHAAGLTLDKSELYKLLYERALAGDADGGGLISYNFYSGEPVVGLDEGRPLLARMADSSFTLANLMRTHLYGTMATLKIGMDILIESENVQVDRLLGHGGLFKTKHVAQGLMATALKTPIAVMDSAAEGGAWGAALLADYLLRKQPEEMLEQYLSERVFGNAKIVEINPDKKDAAGFEAYLSRYKEGLIIEKAAIENLK